MINNQIEKWLLNYLGNLPIPNSKWPHLVINTVSFIHQHLFDEWLTVTSIKNHQNISNNNFSAKFKYFTGYKIKEHIQLLRLNAARQLLEKSEFDNIAVIDIAIRLGYSDYSTFHNAFKKKFKISPVKYRNITKQKI